MVAPRILAFLSAVALLGCAGVRQVVAGAFERPRLHFESAGVESFDLEGATAVARYHLENPNGFGIRVARLSYGLEVEGRRVAAGALPAGLHLPSRGSAPLVVPVRVRYQDLPGFLETVARRDRVAYRVAGAVGFDTAIGPVDLPYSHSGEVPLPRLPSFSLESVRVGSAGLGGVTVDLRIRVGNGNAFPIPGGRLEYRLDLNGAPAVRSAAAALSPVAARGSAVLDVPVRIDVLAAGLGLGQALSSGRAEVLISGAAAYGSLRLPVELRGATR